MPPLTSPAIVLHVIPYGDTSKILKLLTREAGLVSAIARGARRPRSRTGPRLDLFSTGTATIFTRPTRELHPLVAFELSNAHGAIACDVARFAAASALAEVALRLAPADPHPEIFDAVDAGLSAIEHAPESDRDAAALVALWGLVAALGFTPTLDRCVACGKPASGAVHFSPAQGGTLCAAHRVGLRTSTLKPSDRDALEHLASGRLPPEPLDGRHASAHRRLLISYLRHHLAADRELPALAFWDSESWNATS
ncbi:MAG TPA: DNA repair protein RecO [Gemmatimonadales bacterium]|nr:DNA repair protein RecO [Gemmatimonadales bacterium]